MVTLMDDFLVRALYAGLGVALAAGPLGVFVVWQRLAYFGAALSHAALLGVALGFLLGIDPVIGVAVMCVLVALGLMAMRGAHRLSRAALGADTMLGIIAHGSLALGLIAAGFLKSVRLDLMGYLFGDILAVTPLDLIWIYGGAAVILAFLMTFWRALVAVSVHEELASVEGVNVQAMRLLLMLLLALLVALAMKVVGILLVTSLLIVPAAAARRFATSPEGMAVTAASIAMASVIGGLGVALWGDLPAGPAIVVTAVAIFALGGLRFRRRSGA